MQEMWDILRERVVSDPLASVAHIVWLLAFGIVTLKYGWHGGKATWRGAKATGRFTHRLLVTPPKPPEPETPPSPLAAAILQELDGETISDGVSVLAGGVQVWPSRQNNEKRVFIDSGSVDARFSELDMNRITTRAAEVVAAEKKRRDDLETAGLVAKVRPITHPQLQSGPVILGHQGMLDCAGTAKKRA